ncbi:MAG: hypothetical protein ACT4QA_04005 [Panacagrimonas sp.]
MRMVPVVVQSLRLTGLGMAGVPVAACGSSGSGGSSGPGTNSLRVAALPFTPAGIAVPVGNTALIDGGAPAPGRGRFFCGAGSISEAAATSTSGGGLRTVTFTADPCFPGDADSVQDGL